MSDKISILIADDNDVFREGLKVVVQSQPDFVLAGEADNPHNAVEKTIATQPDVVIMDFRQGSGIEACREIVKNIQWCKVIMLTSWADDEMVIESIVAGASGYVLKQIDRLGLVDAIRMVYAGKAVLDPEITPKVIAWIKSLVQNETKKQEPLTLQGTKTTKL